MGGKKVIWAQKYWNYFLKLNSAILISSETQASHQGCQKEMQASADHWGKCFIIRDLIDLICLVY